MSYHSFTTNKGVFIIKTNNEKLLVLSLQLLHILAFLILPQLLKSI